ncbi:valine--tRNA ligase [Gloeobacter morelensis]|uniref:Valine--tRNA ligase n=1 Tax=Gloeobacter morelensis MG652769 TaxID=2781736 RepID=A0ABY3PKK9_9CYAN|nr:valine--tRNA ligase [Gloeobacter morelensis]UFP94119.1 valine--tRNA ligase [Gloeobacter morelensis MG652769]
MARTLPSQYDPFDAEPRWQRFWEEHRLFSPAADSPGEPYSVVLPPPNVTGSLHMGHALCFTLPDVVVRYRRMKGFKTLWLPGTDHASIAVHTVLEKQLRQEGKTRFDLGREAFLERAWAWKEQSQDTIRSQLRRLGLSLDWTRESFTLDEKRNRAVVKVFVDLHRKNLIYRGKSLVNWCPASQTAVSDLEVDDKEEKGHLWQLKYPVADSDEFLVVATTRPETMLGDTGVAVHPEDPRYKHLIGREAVLPILGRRIVIVGDAAVDREFGTGAVKVTPAHDPNDFEIGHRHGLPMINLLNPDGTYNENAGPYAGLDRFVVRKRVVARAEAEGWLVGIEDHIHNVPYSERGGVPIEPYLSDQWFLDVSGMAARVLEAFDSQNQPAFVPERWGKVYRDWLVRIRPWNISRQLWWGHQIPAWFVAGSEGEYVVAHDEAEAFAVARERYGPAVQLQRDQDVLDTWFSSSLWPFTTLGWPEQTEDLGVFYPNALMSTGFDIIFFWVARMAMMAGEFTGQIPFETVYINGLVRDEKGQKMSKTKGNGIDPIEMMDKYGTDALRYTLVREVTGAGQDVRFDYNRKTGESGAVDASKRFANKIWNASRFVLMNLDELTPAVLGAPDPGSLTLEDRWILGRLGQTARQIDGLLGRYALGEAARSLYEFIWDDFCDWYVELAKPRLEALETRRGAQQVLAAVLDRTLRLLHPWMPHLSEEIWQLLHQPQAVASICVQPFPTGTDLPEEPPAEFVLMQQIVRTIRNLRAFAQVPPLRTLPAVRLASRNAEERAAIEATRQAIAYLGRVEQLPLEEVADEHLKQVAVGVAGTVQVMLPLGGLVDVAALAGKIRRSLEKLDKESGALAARLDNESYLANAPAELVTESRAKLAEQRAQAAILAEQLSRLES